MCKLIGRPPLFKSDHKAYQRPTGFGILIRPTKKEFCAFALQLDQLLSDDLNREFFKGEISVSEKLTKENGETVTQPIGTITLLKTWLEKKFRPADQEPMNEMFRDIRFVRQARQKPAHKAEDDEFDQEFLKDQRKLITRAFNGVRTIRMVLENHPAISKDEVPDWLREGRVWTF